MCNTQGLTRVLHLKLLDLSTGEDSGIPSVAVECVDIRRNISGEGDYLDSNWHWGTKAWGANRIRYPGSPRCKRWILDAGGIHSFCVAANAISIPPGEYGRKVETQRNWRGPAQAAEHVVEVDATRKTLPRLDIVWPLWKHSFSSEHADRWCMVVVSSCREMFG